MTSDSSSQVRVDGAGAPTSAGLLIVMYLNDNPWSDDWADAAAQVARVIRVREVKSSAGWIATPLRRTGPSTYELLLPKRGLPHRFFGRGAVWPAVLQHLRALRHIQAEHGTVDVLHAHTYAQAMPLPAVHRRTGIPFVVTEHLTAWTGENPVRRMDSDNIERARRVYAAADRVIPVSEGLRRAIEGRGVQAHFTVVPNPVDCQMFFPSERVGRDSRPTIINVGRHAVEKGLDILLDAAAMLDAEGVPFAMQMIGDGPAHDLLVRKCAELGLGDQVTFVGRRPRPDIADALRRSDVFVLSSWAENLPVALIEAMASGLPIVATDVGSVRELLAEGAGTLVAPGDPIALYEALRARLSAPWTVVEKRRQAEVASMHYSLRQVGARIESIYRDSVATPSP